jgi:putative transposase
MKDKDYSQRRACGLVGIAPKTYRDASLRPDDGAIRQRLRELASERRRFGYRRLHILLRREGVVLNWKKLYRLYREERLMVRKRGGRKRALGTRAPMAIPQGATNAGRWTSSRTRSPAATSSASSPWSKTSAGNAWRSSSTTRSPALGSRASSIA